jgi:hypothetical protein
MRKKKSATGKTTEHREEVKAINLSNGRLS